MKAYVTTIGESTTDLCVWSLERLGFDVTVVHRPPKFADKLIAIFNTAKVWQDFLRVDADVIVNKNVLEMIEQKDLLWYQALTYDWYKQDSTHGGIQFIRKEVAPMVRPYFNDIQHIERPESYLCRIKELHNPRMFGTFEKICGIHGYKQLDSDRVKEVKLRRGQYDNYDWELADRLEKL